MARSTNISFGAGFPASGEILDPLDCVAAGSFSIELVILPLSNIAIPVDGRVLPELTVQMACQSGPQ
jgi:hypothetical protein